MRVNVPVTEIMSTDLVLLNTNDGLEKAERLFKKHHIRHIPVVKGKFIVGMLSYTDLLRLTFADLAEEDDERFTIVYRMLRAEHVMTKNLMVIKPTQTIKEVAEILSQQEFHALPVVDRRTLIGIVTTTDLLKYLLQQYSEVIKE